MDFIGTITVLLPHATDYSEAEEAVHEVEKELKSSGLELADMKIIEEDGEEEGQRKYSLTYSFSLKRK